MLGNAPHLIPRSPAHTTVAIMRRSAAKVCIIVASLRRLPSASVRTASAPFCNATSFAGKQPTQRPWWPPYFPRRLRRPHFEGHLNSTCFRAHTPLNLRDSRPIRNHKCWVRRIPKTCCRRMLPTKAHDLSVELPVIETFRKTRWLLCPLVLSPRSRI